MLSYPNYRSTLAQRDQKKAEQLNALVISQHYPPAFHPEALVTAKLVLALTQRDVNCEVVCGVPLGPVEAATCWDILPEPHQIAVEERRLLRRLKHVQARLRNGYFGNISCWTLGAQKACDELVSRDRFDFILTRMESEDATVIGHNLWSRTNIPWVAYFGDPPMRMYPPPYGPEKRSWRDAPSLAWLRRVLPTIPMAIFPSHRLADYYRNALGIELDHNVAIIPHIGWRAEAKEAIHHPERLLILHIGGLGKHRVAIDALVGLDSAMEDVPVTDLAVEVMFVGTPEPALVSYVKEHPMKAKVSFHPPVTYETSLELMDQADALLLIEASLDEGIFLPSKFCDYAVSGKPILMYSPPNGTVADIVGGNNHPGFMGQTAEGARAAFAKFLAAALSSRELDHFLVPAEQFHPHNVAKKFLGELRSRVMNR